MFSKKKIAHPPLPDWAAIVQPEQIRIIDRLSCYYRIKMFFKKKITSPPVPKWKPTMVQPTEHIIDRLKYYTDGKRDFVVFLNGTCVILQDNLSDNDAEIYAKEVLHHIIHFHPDMTPVPMDDGNLLIQYNHPAVNIVLQDIALQHQAEIDKNHQRALAGSEALITPLGVNIFDEVGKNALFGRCFMFMDALNPKIVKIVRK